MLEDYWQGFADAKPSESIQRHELPGLAVALLFPYYPDGKILELPVKQYKDYKQKSKANRAKRLTDWLMKYQEKGLRLVGFAHAHRQDVAARLGMELIKELPETKVESHYDSYRLFYGDMHIDFPQAVALQYYFFTINLGALRAGLQVKSNDRKIAVLMDRFPGPEISDAIPGNPIPPSPGLQFLYYIESRSETGIAIGKENKSENLDIKFGNLDWWQLKGQNYWKDGKTHPYFILPDWLAAASLAKEFPEEFIASFSREKDGVHSVDNLQKLYDAFKSFDVWSMEGNVLEHIIASDKKWKIPNDAREFIISRAARS